MEKTPKTVKKPRRYQIHLLKERCKGCLFCIEFCPKQSLKESTEFNRKGYHLVCADNLDACTGCKLCEMLCPEFAISVVPEEESTR
ncbi:MAG: ferredoxin family protein [Chloroflexota bacterium]|nr:ferredoxin family protein [Chloroflexota bacterium]